MVGAEPGVSRRPLRELVLGDGVVRPRSALGGSLFPDADVLRLRTHHFGLLDHPEIRGARATG